VDRAKVGERKNTGLRTPKSSPLAAPASPTAPAAPAARRTRRARLALRRGGTLRHRGDGGMPPVAPRRALSFGQGVDAAPPPES